MSDCIIAPGRAVSGYGYRQVTVGSRRVYAHRLAYEAVKGPIPPGMQVDHLCGVKTCINPDHLEAVTEAENIRRAVAKHYGPTCPQGHDDWVEVKTRPGKRRCRICHNQQSNAAYHRMKGTSA